jgi:hypothetical protein
VLFFMFHFGRRKTDNLCAFSIVGLGRLSARCGGC